MTSTHTPTRPTTTTTDPAPSRGRRVELARYDTDTSVRILVGQCIDGTVRRLRRAHRRRPHLRGRGGPGGKAALDALVTDYLAKAKRTGYAPMHGWF